MKLGNYVLGNWIEGEGEGQQLYNAVTGDFVAAATTKVWILDQYWNMEERKEARL